MPNPSVTDAIDDPPDEPELPCEVCLRPSSATAAEGGCVCPPCPFCSEVGRLECYTNERVEARLPLRREQALGRIRYRAALYAEAAERERQYADWLETSQGEVSPHIEDYPTTI